MATTWAVHCLPTTVLVRLPLWSWLKPKHGSCLGTLAVHGMPIIVLVSHKKLANFSQNGETYADTDANHCVLKHTFWNHRVIPFPQQCAPSCIFVPKKMEPPPAKNTRELPQGEKVPQGGKILSEVGVGAGRGDMLTHCIGGVWGTFAPRNCLLPTLGICGA